jgi:hypothetical protein
MGGVHENGSGLASEKDLVGDPAPITHHALWGRARPEPTVKRGNVGAVASLLSVPPPRSSGVTTSTPPRSPRSPLPQPSVERGRWRTMSLCRLRIEAKSC